MRGKYDAAQTNDDNRRHWANADPLSAGAANSRAVRRTLRNRARYEYANNSYLKGIVDTLANDVVGKGPRLQVQTGNAEADTRIEKTFNVWARQVGLAAKLRTGRKAKAIDGEAFLMLVDNPKLPGPITLDLRTIETEQVSDPDDTKDSCDGIKLDTNGNPISYTVLKNHPGSPEASTDKLPPVPANMMIHWFSADRPGQIRGVPDVLPSLPLGAQLRRFTLAVVAAAETAADFAAIVKSTSTANTDPDDIEPFVPIEIEQRAMLTLPFGWDMSQLKAEQPTTTYGDFKGQLINEIARPVHMPFNIAACNSSGYNYSSGKLDHQTYYKSIGVQQDELELVALHKILVAWLAEAALVPGLLNGAPPYAEWVHSVTWFWDGQEHVDPTKEANAQQTRLANHTTTLANEYARQGSDWEKELRQRARELELMAELGLPFGEQGGAMEEGEDDEGEEVGEEAGNRG